MEILKIKFHFLRCDFSVVIFRVVIIFCVVIMGNMRISRRSSHDLSVAAIRLLQGFTESFNVLRTWDFGAGLVSREPRASDLSSISTSLLVEAADPMPMIYVSLRDTSREIHRK